MRYDIVVKEMTGMEITGTGDGGVSADVPVGRNVLEVPSDVDRLYEVIDFVKESLGGLGVSERAMAQIELVVEEIYVNIASYAYPPGTGKVWAASFCAPVRVWPTAIITAFTWRLSWRSSHQRAAVQTTVTARQI